MQKISNLVLFYLILSGSTAVVLTVWAENEVQPIVYNHKIHVEEVGLSCEECHVNVNMQARASIPNIQICGDCHNDVESEKQETRKVAKFVTDGNDIPWVQVHNVPDHAYFSHRRHVVLAQIECSICHGDVSKMEKPFTMPYTTIEMRWCLDCHEKRSVSTDCYACHR